MSREKFKMKPGMQREFQPTEPAIFITGTGRGAYLWVGNDAPTTKACFATISGHKTLENLAKTILRQIKIKKIKPSVTPVKTK